LTKNRSLQSGTEKRKLPMPLPTQSV